MEVTDKPIEKEDGLALVLLRHQFYQDNYYCAVFGVILLLIINFFLIFSIVYKLSHPPHPVYFGTTSDGRIIMTYPLTDPVLADDVVLNWATNAVRKAFSLDYKHFQEQLGDAMVNFTPAGKNGFIDSLKSTNNLETLTKLKMVSDVGLTGAPEVIDKRVISGHYAWKINMPLLLTFTGDKPISMPMNVTLIVIRMPETDYPNGIALNNFIAETGGN